MINWSENVEDAFIAIKAAEVMAKRYKHDVWIMQDLRVIHPDDIGAHKNEPPLEVVRFIED